MATRLGDMAVGSTVKIKVNGTLTDFLIVQQGKPSSIYDDSCNGTWLLMNDVYTTSVFGYTSSFGNNYNNYEKSPIHSHLNNTFFSLIDGDIRNAIKQVKIPYKKGLGSQGSLATGANGLSTKVFLLSGYEVGWTTRDSEYFPKDGVRLAYFFDGRDGDSKRIAYYNSRAAIWWLRSPYTDNDSTVWAVRTNGSSVYESGGNNHGVRPAFILPSSLFVSDDGTVSVNTAPTVTTDGAELGEKNAAFAWKYTVTDADGDTLTVTEKLDGKTTKTRTGVASGTALTFEQAAEATGFQRILNGSHTITVEVSDDAETVSTSATFTKNVTGAQVSLTATLTADDTITVAALTLEGSFPADMSLTVELTNNALDDSPVWENCTDIQRGESRTFVHHAFTKKTAARGFAFNYKVTIARGASGVGGNITMIGGVIG